MKKRLFIAIDLPISLKQNILLYQQVLRKASDQLRVSWERAEKLHLTLKFLGDTDETQLENLQTIVRQIADKSKNFRLQIAGTGVFRMPQNPRVLWLGLIDEEEKLSEMNEHLEATCEKIGFSRENRSFVPHLTIARIREPRKSRQLAQRHLQSKFGPIEFEVSEIVIYESRLEPSGSVYSPIFKAGFEII